MRRRRRSTSLLALHAQELVPRQEHMTCGPTLLPCSSQPPGPAPRCPAVMSPVGALILVAELEVGRVDRLPESRDDGATVLLGILRENACGPRSRSLPIEKPYEKPSSSRKT